MDDINLHWVGRVAAVQLVRRLAESAAAIIREIDAVLAAGSIANARSGVQENVRARALDGAVVLSDDGRSGGRVAV